LRVLTQVVANHCTPVNIVLINKGLNTTYLPSPPTAEAAIMVSMFCAESEIIPLRRDKAPPLIMNQRLPKMSLKPPARGRETVEVIVLAVSIQL
jgi:hypothetical protein